MVYEFQVDTSFASAFSYKSRAKSPSPVVEECPPHNVASHRITLKVPSDLESRQTSDSKKTSQEALHLHGLIYRLGTSVPQTIRTTNHCPAGSESPSPFWGEKSSEECTNHWPGNQTYVHLSFGAFKIIPEGRTVRTPSRRSRHQTVGCFTIR